MKNPYLKILKEERKDSVLSELIDFDNYEIKESTETERIRLLLSFIANRTSIIKVGDLIKQLSFLEKSLAGEFGGNFFVYKKTRKRFQAFARADHYKIILSNAFKELSFQIKGDILEIELDSNQLRKLASTVWH